LIVSLLMDMYGIYVYHINWCFWIFFHRRFGWIRTDSGETTRL